MTDERICEVWRPVVGYVGYYEVSNIGNVRGVSRRIDNGRGGTRLQEPLVIKQVVKSNGYCYVALWKDGKMKALSVHRLVGKAFVDNPDNKPEINHKDEDKQNNRASNLQWCTRKENENYGTKRQRQVEHTDYEEIAKKNSKPVTQSTLDGQHIRTWDSLSNMHRETGFSKGDISCCCNGKRKNHLYGYRWAYV